MVRTWCVEGKGWGEQGWAGGDWRETGAQAGYGLRLAWRKRYIYTASVCRTWQSQNTRSQTNCLLPLPCRWLCTHRLPGGGERGGGGTKGKHYYYY